MLDRNIKDETSEDKKYSCWRIKISKAMENYTAVAFIYSMFFPFNFFYQYICQYLHLNMRTLKKNTANTTKKLTIIHLINGQISNCLINVINALKKQLRIQYNFTYCNWLVYLWNLFHPTGFPFIFI